MASEKVWIENTQPRIIHLPSDVKRVGGREITDINGASRQVDEQVVLEGNGKQLTPSYKNTEGKFLTADGKTSTLNAIDKKFWDRKKNKPAVKTWLRLGWLKIHDQGTAETDLPDSLTRYGIPTARALIEGEDNLKLLEEWRTQEARPEVIGSIDARLDELKTAPAATGSAPTMAASPSALPPLKGKRS